MSLTARDMALLARAYLKANEEWHRANINGMIVTNDEPEAVRARLAKNALTDAIDAALDA